MANIKIKRKENAPGNFYVDSTCIDCGTCYWIAPETFQRVSGMSAVIEQPAQNSVQEAALKALFSCPTNSIGEEKKSILGREIASSFPHQLAENIFHLGFHARDSYGATSYFIQSEQGNLMIDSPRYLKPLSKSLFDLGGLSFHLLSHQDDVADTDKYHRDFKGKRVIHTDDTNSVTSKYEVILTQDERSSIHPEVETICVPGHTKGSVCYLYKGKFLFTGDHLAYSPELGHLYAFKNACWYDFEAQIASMEKLLGYSFEYVFPGHGAPFQASPQEMKKSLEKCIAWMKK